MFAFVGLLAYLLVTKVLLHKSQESLRSFLKSLSVSDTYCFCCGMNITESRLNPSLDWNYDDNVEDEYGNTSNKDQFDDGENSLHLISPTETSHFESSSMPNELSRSRCTCCGRQLNQRIAEISHTDFEPADAGETALKFCKRQKTLKCDSTGTFGLVKLIDFNSAVQAAPPELYIYDSGRTEGLHYCHIIKNSLLFYSDRSVQLRIFLFLFVFIFRRLSLLHSPRVLRCTSKS